MISKSPQRYSFQVKAAIKKLEEDPTDTEAIDTVEWNTQIKADVILKEQSEEWRQDNLEYDLRATQWILDKVRADDVYAQHLYAAMCNTDFTKNAVWPILQEKQWSCSWRRAGGIVADMQERGDYIDWYCSGIRGEDMSEADFSALSKERQEQYLRNRAYVSEGKVTDEIRADLLTLGWIVCSDE